MATGEYMYCICQGTSWSCVKTFQVSNKKGPLVVWFIIGNWSDPGILFNWEYLQLMGNPKNQPVELERRCIVSAQVATWFVLFPTCQVRVVRFYVSLFSSSSSSSSFSSFSSASSSVSLSCRESVCSVWHVGPQLRSCEFSVACWTSTAILWVQCGVPDPNRDPACSVWRAGPQLWSRVFSAVCRTSTAILRVQCGIPDLNRDYASSVWRAGPHL